MSKAGAFPDLPAMLKKAAAKPESISMAYTGHVKSLSVDWLGMLTESAILKVPYKGDNDAISGLMGGRVDVAMIGPSVTMPLVMEKKLDALAVTSTERLSLLPNVPAVSESVPGFKVDVWTGLVSQSKVPRTRVKILRDALEKTVNDPEFQTRLSQTGDVVAIGIGQTFTKRISNDLAMWRNVMKEANIPQISP